MSIKNTDILSTIQAWSEGAVKLPRILRKGVASIKAGSASNQKSAADSAKAGSNSTAGAGRSTSSGATAPGSIAQASPGLKKVSSSGGYGGSSGGSAGGNSSGSSVQSGQSGGGKRGFGFAGPKVIIKANYIRGIKRVGAHIKYIEHRQHDERSELFGKNADNLDRYWFTDKVGKYDNIFRIVISPADKNIDLKDMAREVLASFEKRKDRELTWIAATHTDPQHTSHPHVHMVLSGTTEAGNRIRMEKGDIEFLRKEASEYISREKNLFNAMESFFPGNKKEKEKERDIGL